jgi:hypothetical protein
MENSSGQKQVLQVSANYRWIENGHILLWLIKDTCWALEFKPGGIFMIFPTVFVAFYITWKSRAMRSELYHNIAVCCWILANSVWMLGEFFEHESRPHAATLFVTGLVVLGYYYLRFFTKDRRAERELNQQ